MRQRTVTLTDRPPVRIVEDDWPLIAQSDWTRDPRNRAQLRVRRNASGQLLAYGVFWCGRVVARAGFALSAAGASVPGAAPAAIRRTVEHMSRYRLAEQYLPDWVQLADECIADLPAEELV